MHAYVNILINLYKMTSNHLKKNPTVSVKSQSIFLQADRASILNRTFNSFRDATEAHLKLK